jgi:haloacetate dehalogenase
MVHGAEDLRIDTGEAVISVTRLGSGPAVLLLHGFPQTKLMWRDIAPQLAERFTVICADLRGYGDSSTPPSDADHAAYSKRAMARDMVSVMAQLGFACFSIAGHDRGGRVAYRTALDHPARVEALAVLDVLPVDAVWDRADDRLALGFWPWSLLAQPEPLPERLIAGAPDAVTGDAFSGAWGSPAGIFGDQVRAAYTAALSDPARIHAICEEYRAAAGIDRDHDAADRAAGRVITCPVLALWSASGPLGSWYHHDGGPLALWRQVAPDVTGAPVHGGHFFPEEQPAAIAATLTGFFARTPNHRALPPPAAVSPIRNRGWLAGSQRARCAESPVLALLSSARPIAFRGSARPGIMVSLLPTGPVACRDRGRGRGQRRQSRAGRGSGPSRWHALAARLAVGRGAGVRRGCRHGRR